MIDILLHGLARRLERLREASPFSCEVSVDERTMMETDEEWVGVDEVPVEIKVLKPGLLAIDLVPDYASAGAAGLDLHAAIETSVTLAPGQVMMVPTGIAIHIDDVNYAAFLYPRSGKSVKEGLMLANGVGVIDSDYQGEILVAVWNRNIDRPVTIEPGERIAQMVLQRVATAQFKVVSTFSEMSERGAGGFGSTGSA